jgi:hypothetical protein
LLAECKQLEKDQAKGKDVTEQLTHVYDELRAIGADQAEPKARRLLAGNERWCPALAFIVFDFKPSYATFLCPQV